MLTIICATSFFMMIGLCLQAWIRTESEFTDLHTPQERWRMFYKNLHQKTIVVLGIICIVSLLWPSDVQYHHSQLPTPKGPISESLDQSDLEESEKFQYNTYRKDFVE